MKYSSPEINDAKIKIKILCPSNKKIHTGYKIWRPGKCSEKSSMGIIQKGKPILFLGGEGGREGRKS